MSSQIEFARHVLERFLVEKRDGKTPFVDREQVVAHALLSGWRDHWPSQVDARTRELLAETAEIKAAEGSRWMTQRRIAIAKLARAFELSQAPARGADEFVAIKGSTQGPVIPAPSRI